MTAAWRWVLLGVALASVGVAVWADTDLATAVPAAAVAVGATALLFVEAWPVVGRPVGRLRHRPTPTPNDALRAAFRSGRMGRETFVTLLDRLEREGPNPTLPIRRPSDLEPLLRLSPEDFRDYLRRRLDDLEARS